MKMTRQHFEFVASVLKATRNALDRMGDTTAAAMFNDTILPMVADELAQTNPNFDRQRFIEACGVSADGEDLSPTGRHVQSKPNLQSMPIDSEEAKRVRKAFLKGEH